uniref:Uncharacterized protein n=1 Tax=Strongyloides stercoralis TaxID=6248 RepID=A0AAF5DSD2_STRER
MSPVRSRLVAFPLNAKLFASKYLASIKNFDILNRNNDLPINFMKKNYLKISNHNTDQSGFSTRLKRQLPRQRRRLQQLTNQRLRSQQLRRRQLQRQVSLITSQRKRLLQERARRDRVRRRRIATLRSAALNKQQKTINIMPTPNQTTLRKVPEADTVRTTEKPKNSDEQTTSKIQEKQQETNKANQPDATQKAEPAAVTSPAAAA